MSEVRPCCDCGEPTSRRTDRWMMKPFRCASCAASRKINQRESYKVVPLKCLTCKSDFLATDREAPTAKFCSRKCRWDAVQRGLWRQATVRAPIVAINCHACGIEFKTPQKLLKYMPKFCSYKCAGIGKILQWPKSNRARTVAVWLRKHGHITECEACGYDTRPEILTIHHRDRDRGNNKIENLAILCPNCHAIEHLSEQKLSWQERKKSALSIAVTYS